MAWFVQASQCDANGFVRPLKSNQGTKLKQCRGDFVSENKLGVAEYFPAAMRIKNQFFLKFEFHRKKSIRSQDYNSGLPDNSLIVFFSPIKASEAGLTKTYSGNNVLYQALQHKQTSNITFTFTFLSD